MSHSSNTNKPAIQSISHSMVPRNFILLNSIDRAGQFSNVQYGLTDDDNGVNKDNYVNMENWSCTIVYDDGRDDFNIFELKLKVPQNFPIAPPVATFAGAHLSHPRINRMCNSDGTLNSSYLNAITSDWNKNMEIPEFLMWLYNKIRNRS